MSKNGFVGLGIIDLIMAGYSLMVRTTQRTSMKYITSLAAITPISILVLSILALALPCASAQQKRPNNGSTGPTTTVQFTPKERAWLNTKQTVRVRIGSAIPFHSSTPEPQGISVDYLKLIGKRHGIDFQFVTTPASWKEALEDLTGAHKWFDLQPTIKKTPERAKQIAFTQDYLFSPWVIVNRTGADFIARIDDLNGKNVAIEKGYVVADLVRSHYPIINIVEFSTTIEALRAVAEARTEAYIGNLSTASFIINKNGLENLKVAAPTPFGDHNQAMGIRSDWPELASIIDKALDAMTDAEKQAIHNRWFSVRYDHGLNPKKVWAWIAGITAVFLLVLAITLAWNNRLKKEVARRLATETLLRESETAALAAKHNLEDAQRVAHVGSWIFDIPGNSAIWSREVYSIFGVTVDTPLTFELFFNCVHPEDREMLSTAWTAALKGGPYDIKHRIIVGDQVKWVHELAHVVFDQDGKALSGIGTVQDITESMLAKEALEKANQLLEVAATNANAANRAKSEFLANMSHEIRTPMNGMLGMAQLLRYTQLTQEQQEYIDNLESSGKNLLALINDILDLAKIESGKMQLDDVDFSLSRCIQEIVALQNSLVRQKGLHLTTEIEQGLPYLVRGDALRFNQILLNLVGNAIKFTQRGTISIIASLQSRTDQSVIIRVEVKDTGIGIPAESIARIFDSFEQADNSTTRTFGGSGLGLSICRRLVALMRGIIGVESVVGVGSTFFVELPFVVSSQQQIVISQDQQHLSDVGTSRQLRLLVAEDNPSNAKATEAMLNKIGHLLEIATNGQEALELYRNGTFDAILMDVQMPVIDGERAVAAIREHEQKTGVISR